MNFYTWLRINTWHRHSLIQMTIDPIEDALKYRSILNADFPDATSTQLQVALSSNNGYLSDMDTGARTVP